MLFEFKSDHKNPHFTVMNGKVYSEGHFVGRLLGFVFYEQGVIIIHDPIARKSHNISIDVYDDFEGNMEDFINHILDGGIS